MAVKSLVFTPLTDATFTTAERCRIYSVAWHTVMRVAMMADAVRRGGVAREECADAMCHLTKHLAELYPDGGDPLAEIIVCADADALGVLDWIPLQTGAVQ